MILVDVDGVLLDFLGGLRRMVKGLEVTEYDLRKNKRWPEIDRALNCGWLEGSLDFFPGALDFLDALRRRGREVLLVTAPGPTPAWDASRNVRLRGLCLPWAVVPAGERWRIHADALLDDRPDTVADFDSGKSRGVLFVQPYNAHLAPDFTYTASTYAEALEILAPC